MVVKFVTKISPQSHVETMPKGICPYRAHTNRGRRIAFVTFTDAYKTSSYDVEHVLF